LEESVTIIIMVERISKLTTTLAVTNNWIMLRRKSVSSQCEMIPSTLMMEDIRSSETFHIRATRHHIPDNGIHQSPPWKPQTLHYKYVLRRQNRGLNICHDHIIRMDYSSPRT
jgi:hypothetical protein